MNDGTMSGRSTTELHLDPLCYVCVECVSLSVSLIEYLGRPVRGLWKRQEMSGIICLIPRCTLHRINILKTLCPSVYFKWVIL